MRYVLKTLKNLLLVAIFVYVLFGIMLYVAQDTFIMPGDNERFEDCQRLPEAARPISHDGERFFYANNSDDAIVVLYHGNAASGCAFPEIARTLERAGVSYIMTAYPGFAGDERRPDVGSMLDYTKTISGFIADEDYGDVMLIGYSIGGGAASYHVTHAEVSSVFLISTFSRLSEVASGLYPIYPVRLLLKENLLNDVWLMEHDGEITIVYTEDDIVVQSEHTERLIIRLEDAGKELEHHLVDGVNHGSIIKDETLLMLLSEKIGQFG